MPAGARAATSTGWRRTCWRFTSDAYTPPLRQRQPGGPAAGLPGRTPSRRGDPIIWPRAAAAAVLSLPLVPRAAPAEPSRRLSRPRRAIASDTRAGGRRPTCGAGRQLGQHLGGYCGHGQAAGRGARPAAGRAAQPGAARQHRRAVHQRPRLSFQDPQRRIQALRTRSSIRIPRRCRARASRAAAGSPAGQPDRPAADAARRGRDAIPAEMQGSSLLPLVQRRPDATWRDEMFVQISEA